MAKVSIIIPVYNVERYLPRCLDSVINQTYGDIEILCVNDGSTDNSGKILAKYQKLDSRIKIINRENGGLSVARNTALDCVTGDYILFVDSDDYVSSLLVEKSLENALKNDCDVVFFDYMSGSPDYSDAISFSTEDYLQYENKPFSIDSMEAESYKIIPCTTWSKLYKTSFLKDNNIKFVENLYYEDFPFWAEVYTKAKRMTYLPIPLYYYNTGRKSSIMHQMGEKTFDAIVVYDKVIQIIKSGGYWEKYKVPVNLLMAINASYKFEQILPEYRLRFYNELKRFCYDIDYSAYENDKYSNFEKDKMRNFCCLKTADYDTFCRIMGVDDEKA